MSTPEPTVPLPELFQAVLDRAQLEDLLADIGFCASAASVTLKGAPQRYVEGEVPGLEQARRALDEQAVRGIQIRYVHQGTMWLDTLIRAGESWRLTRIASGAPS